MNGSRNIVLVGTYRPANEAWIRDRRLYNLPLPKILSHKEHKGHKAGGARLPCVASADGHLAFHEKISGVVLFAEGHPNFAFKAKFKDVVDGAWLKENGYALSAKPHGEKYALYELCEESTPAKLLGVKSAEVFVSSSRCPCVKIDEAFYSKPYPVTGGKSMPYVFDCLKPYFKKWKSATTFNPVQMDFFAMFKSEAKERKHARPIAIDLFAGCGGLSLGFEQAGFDIVAAVEIDPIHAAVHEYNFPNAATICADIKNISGNDIRERAGIGARDVDIVFGGAPCQGFSMIGKRALDDPRNQLISHFLRIVKDMHPKYCVLENVKGLTVGKHSQFLSELIDELKKIDYEVLLPYRVLNAADYGVPQRRERLFLIAARKDQKLPVYPTAANDKITIREAIGDLPDADGFDCLMEDDSVAVKWQTKSVYARRLRGLRSDKTNFGYERTFDIGRLTASLRTKHGEVSQQRFLAAPQGETEPYSRFFKLAWDGQSNTLRAGTDSARGGFTSPRPIHPDLPRVITVREAARIHSYPDWFRFNKTKWHGFREIGNSVPPLLARAVGAEIIKAMGVTPVKPTRSINPGVEELLEFDMRNAADHFGVPRNVIAQRRRK